jgi:hypothetical protein
MADRKPIESWLTDMDGVLIHEGVPIPGADAFLKKLRESGKPFLVLTNNSMYTPRDLHARLRRMGLEVPIESIWTSALATAQFLDDQRPGGSAYVIGEAGLTTALHDIGYILTDHEPDYVVLGETRTTKTYLALTCGLSPSVRGWRPVSHQQGRPSHSIGRAFSISSGMVKRGRPHPRLSRGRGSAGTGSARCLLGRSVR